MQLLFIGTTELILICVVVLLLFGGRKLPEMMRGLGKGLREFKVGLHEPEEKTPARQENVETKDATSEAEMQPISSDAKQ